MKRVIKKIASLDGALRQQLEARYPEGIRAGDLVSFPTPQGRSIQCVELRTEDIIYLIHIPNLASLEERGSGLRVDWTLQREKEN